MRLRAHLSAAVVVGLLLAPALAGAQTENWEAPRTAWGAPDLQGIWDFRTITPMERPTDLADVDVLSDEQAAAVAEQALERHNARDTDMPWDTVGNYNAFWFDPGGNVVDTRRSSLVVDPPDGRIPAKTPEAQARYEAGTELGRGLRRHTPTPGGFVEDLGPGGVQVRCIVGFNQGPPMTPGAYNNNMQLFQTEEQVVIYNEMNHDARIAPFQRDHGPIPQWLGSSRARWEGDTLVVETRNFRRETAFQSGLTGTSLHLTERFTRVSPEVLVYQATVNDPTVWTAPWTYEVPMQRSDLPLYEYACHEGNYGIYNILAGARDNPESNVLTPEQVAEEAARR